MIGQTQAAPKAPDDPVVRNATAIAQAVHVIRDTSSKECSRPGCRSAWEPSQERVHLG